jgi:hypothetical protein
MDCQLAALKKSNE